MNKQTFFCKNPCGKYGHFCTRPAGHKGRCSYGAVSNLIEKIDTKAGKKLSLDTYSTPGNTGAAKNRANRCYPIQYTKSQIYEANKRGEHSVCIPVRFSSTQKDCFDINIDLATQIVSIIDLEFDINSFSEEQRSILSFLMKESRRRFPNNLRCRICNEPILLENFYTDHATSHERSVQLGHIVPHINGKDGTAHVSGNTQWIHRDCNIIQGDKTEEETFEMLRKILSNQGYQIQINTEVLNG